MPLIRSSFLKSGLILSGVNSKPLWAMWAAAPAKPVTTMTRTNGGSAAIASHQVADFTKIGIRALAPLDPSLLTCFANDFGYENAFANVIKVSGKRGDVLFAISSSGESRNILNAVAVAKEKKMAVVTLSGFNESNPLRKMGEINFYVPSSSYRCVESAHLFIFNCILDFFLAVTNYRPAPIWS